jgi:LytS/YehU family sensor histidine kinase
VNTAFVNANEDVCRFSIALPFWREKWFIALSIFAVLGLVYYITNRREKNLRKFTSLQRERMMFEYEHLKSQVNPHFLFNSLNTLASLIEEDKQVASDYTTHLSDLYRNMLAHRNEDLITLEEEWEILTNYIYIQNSRFGDALVVETQIPDYVMQNKKIVPLALQLIVENAIKHNVVSKTRPLHISIVADNESITIRNSLNPKISKEKGAGLGMVNIKNRYNLLTKKSIYYGISDKEYVVNLPLL